MLQINVVTEERLYQSWNDNPKPNPGLASIKSGMIAAKLALNKLHYQLGHAGFNQVHGWQFYIQ